MYNILYFEFINERTSIYNKHSNRMALLDMVVEFATQKDPM